MATLGRWTASAASFGNLPETFAAPNALFPTETRNDGSTYTFTSSTSTLTLPASGLADGYLFVAYFQFTEAATANRFNPQGQIVQASGTGTFVGGPTGGYHRDPSEDRSYVRCWAFVDGPSASSTYQFQWKADTDDANAASSVNSAFDVIPLFYSDVGVYSSTSAALYGGTTPNQVTGFTGTDGVNITLTSNVISVTGDNKRYLVLASQFFEGRGGRTQRWHGLEIDGTQENAAKAYSYYRNGGNDESGDLFTWLLETSTATITIEQTCYRGDGVAAGQGGANIDGSTPAVGDHATVVIELNDSAEVFRSENTAQSSALNVAGPVDLPLTPVAGIAFNDSASWVRSTDNAMNAEVAMDALIGANPSAAAEAVANTTRFTAASNVTVNGTEDAHTTSGDYLRNNQGSADTFGWSANLLSFVALSLNDDVGVSVTELSGSESGGDPAIQPGWGGFWGINLDTLESGATLTATSIEATAAGVATLNRRLSLFRDIDATDTGSATLLFRRSFSNLSLAASSVGTATIGRLLLLRRAFSAAVTGVATSIADSIASLDEITLAATSTGSAVLSRLSSLFRTFSATVTGAATLARGAVLSRLFSVAATGTATLVDTLIAGAELFLETISATAAGSATLSRVVTYSRAFAASVTGVATLNRLLFLKRVLDATVTGLATLIADPLASLNEFTLAATATGTAALNRLVTYSRSIAVTVTGLATISFRNVFSGVVFSVAATGAATLNRLALLFRTFTVSVTGVAQAIAVFLVGMTEIVFAATVTAVGIITSVHISFIQPFTGHGGAIFGRRKKKWKARKPTWQARPGVQERK